MRSAGSRWEDSMNDEQTTREWPSLFGEFRVLGQVGQIHLFQGILKQIKKQGITMFDFDVLPIPSAHQPHGPTRLVFCSAWRTS